MTDINNHINQLHEKLQLLIKEYKQLQKDNKKLQKDITVLENEQTAKNLLLQQLEQKVTAVQITGGQWEDSQKQALQKKIDAYLKEIDKCLALLHA
jgi:peptidoglycan hydrolase CwlO-like protein